MDNWENKFKANLLEVLYRPDQPRDERGRWTTGGGEAYSDAVISGDLTTARRLVHEKATDVGYEVLHHVGAVDIPTIGHGSVTGGSGEFFVSSDPEVWKDTLGRGQDQVTDWAIPKDQIATESPSQRELADWAIDRGFLEQQTVTRPDGSVVYELDGVTPMVRPVETSAGKDLPFYGVKDPLRGGGQIQKHLLYAYLSEQGYKAYQSEYSPDGHEIAIFDLSTTESAAPVVYNASGDVIPLSERFKGL